jgi:hypothetical protein
MVVLFLLSKIIPYNSVVDNRTDLSEDVTFQPRLEEQPGASQAKSRGKMHRSVVAGTNLVCAGPGRGKSKLRWVERGAKSFLDCDRIQTLNVAL